MGQAGSRSYATVWRVHAVHAHVPAPKQATAPVGIAFLALHANARLCTRFLRAP